MSYRLEKQHLGGFARLRQPVLICFRLAAEDETDRAVIASHHMRQDEAIKAPLLQLLGHLMMQQMLAMHKRQQITNKPMMGYHAALIVLDGAAAMYVLIIDLIITRLLSYQAHQCVVDPPSIVLLPSLSHVRPVGICYDVCRYRHIQPQARNQMDENSLSFVAMLLRCRGK